MSETFAVVLADPVVEDTATIHKMAEALNVVTGTIPYDGTRMAKNAHGVLIENLSEFQAQQLVSQLESRGIKAGTADGAALGEKPTTRSIKKIVVSEQELSVQLGYTGMDTITWARVDLVSACLYHKPKQKLPPEAAKGRSPFAAAARGFFVAGIAGAVVGAAAAARSQATAGSASTTKPGDDEFYVVDMYVREPREVLRLQSNACDYGYLADRVQPKANDNLKLVLADIVAKTDVILSPMANQLVQGDTLADCKLDNLHMFERYNRWVFLAMIAFAGEGEQAP
jgi:hypothetical protein